MAFKILFVLALSMYLATGFSVVKSEQGHRGPAENGEIPPLNKEGDKEVDWYDCSDKDDGNYAHPHDCTKFMSCVAHNHAYERNCAACDESPIKCPDGKLHYHQPTDRCEWADVAGCNPGGPTTTTKAPPTDDGECEPGCEQRGDTCLCYDTCVENATSSTGYSWKNACCEDGTYWNSDRTVWTHGGSCDYWDNLDEGLQEDYRNQDECPTPPLDCYYRPDENCANKYYYLPAGSKNHGQEQHLTCATYNGTQSLYWNQDELGCRKSCPSDEDNCHVC